MLFERYWTRSATIVAECHVTQHCEAATLHQTNLWLCIMCISCSWQACTVTDITKQGRQLQVSPSRRGCLCIPANHTVGLTWQNKTDNCSYNYHTKAGLLFVHTWGAGGPWGPRLARGTRLSRSAWVACNIPNSFNNSCP